MRKADLELLEVRLEPLQTARDRIDEAMRLTVAQLNEVRDKVRDLERNEEIHKTEIAQGLASIRSLLQRANRAARDVGIIEDDELDPPANPVQVVATPKTPDSILASARARNPEKTIL